MSKDRKQILLASDTHGRTATLELLLKRFVFDELIFCGDGEGLEQEITRLPGVPAVIRMVRGNNDCCTGLVYEAVFELGSHRVFLTHGHRYHLWSGQEQLASAAAEAGCDLCFFGHLHRPSKNLVNGVLCVNPGSLCEPRQFPPVPTAVIIELGPDGEADFRLVRADDGTELPF